MLALLSACSDYFSPVKETGEPTEYEYNYWLLQKTYLYADELDSIPESGDSVQALYAKLADPYTRYTEPSKSQATIESRNTSIITGDIGLEYYNYVGLEYPLRISQVYPNSPAMRAGVPKRGALISINGSDLGGGDALSTYKSIYSQNKEITLVVAYNGDTASYTMERENIYAPTVFIDTISGYTVINIRGFKPQTLDSNGTVGELFAYLDSTRSDTAIRILDLRNNPGGHVDQCVAAADMFVKAGTLSTQSWNTITTDGERVHKAETVYATAGHPGEDGRFVLLINSASASCAEIFAAAVTETTDIPTVGLTSFGKGIGQNTWNTPDGGLATITTLEFLTPSGSSYHKKGIVPDYPCEDGASVECAIRAAEKHFGTKKPDASKNHVAIEPEFSTARITDKFYGEAFVTEDLWNLKPDF